MPRAVTEDELLSGSDDDVSQETVDSLDELKDLEDDDPPPKKDDDEKNVEVVIVDGDEVEEKDGERTEAEASGEVLLDDEDAGEEIGTDYLTAWEKKNFSKAMRGRVNRERRAKFEAEGRAEQEAKGRREAETRLHEAEKMSATLLSKVLDGDIKDKTAELLKAKEDGNSADEIKLQGDLDDLRARRRDVEAAKTRMEERAEVKDEPKTENTNLTRWIGRNRWFGNKEFSRDILVARSLDQELGLEVKAGGFRFGPSTPEYFAELDRRIHAERPQLRSRIRQVYGGTPKPKVAPVVRSGGGRQAQASTGGKVFLTKADLENARNFGLTTKQQLVEYARAKRDREQKERGGRNA